MKTMIRKALDDGPIWLLTALAAWHAALAIVSGTVVLWTWDGEYLDFTVDRLFWAAGLGYFAYVLRENRRLRETPLWRAADAAWHQGYQAATRRTRP